MVITPSAMPNGTELSIGVFPTHKTWTLATANEPLTCTTDWQNQQPARPEPNRR